MEEAGPIVAKGNFVEKGIDPALRRAKRHSQFGQRLHTSNPTKRNSDKRVSARSK
jgi:hypothetical protein